MQEKKKEVLKKACSCNEVNELKEEASKLIDKNMELNYQISLLQEEICELRKQRGWFYKFMDWMKTDE